MSEKIQAYLSAKFVGGLARKEASVLANYVQMATAEIECYAMDSSLKLSFTGVNRGVFAHHNTYQVGVHTAQKGSMFSAVMGRDILGRELPKETKYVFWVMGTEIHAAETCWDGLISEVTYPEPYVGEYSEDLLLWIIRCLLGEVKP